MVGIIAEYNPFHNGHLYHIKKVKEMFPNETITLVLAGHFLNRGDISVINKWDKTLLALQYGIDLVVELPSIYSSQAADIYAYGAIKILNNLKCDHIVFGSETNDINELSEIADKLNKDNDIKEHLKSGYNYPSALSKVYNIPNNPNDLLGISYIKAIKQLKSNIKPVCIKRTNDYHSKTLTKISSATSIRESIKNSKNIKKYIPNYSTKMIKNISLNDYFNILKHQVIIDDITRYNIDEKLAHSIKNNILKVNSIDELIESVKTKNFTYNSIKRGLVQILVGVKKEDLNNNYIRVLGFNDKGIKYLNGIKKELNVPLITKYDKSLDLELKFTKVYSLVYGSNIVELELQKPVKI